MNLQEKLATLPAKPGVYLFKDSGDNILYVGKAGNLWNRVHSYFQKDAAENSRLQNLVARIHNLEYILCDSELEALLLEHNLIKAHHPLFNVRLRDDKRYPLIKLVLTDSFPYLTIARKKADDGNRYFGPYVSSQAMRQTLKLLRKIFLIRSCTMKITGHDRPCLYYHLKECSAPCIAVISQSAYKETVKGVTQFLEGKAEPLVSQLTREMEAASSQMKFEKAAAIRDQIRSVQTVVEKQKVSGSRLADEDYAGIACQQGLCVAEIFHVRQGNLIRKEAFTFESPELDVKENFSMFMRKYYEEAGFIPASVLVSLKPDDASVLQEFLSQKAGTTVQFEIPKRGDKKKMLGLLEKNVIHDLNAALLREIRIRGRMEVLESLQARFGLPCLPFRIEGYDISTLFGKDSVGSMVVFHGGQPEKKFYRKFLIRTKSTPDDFAMMEEMLSRRLRRLTDEDEDESFASTPDLILLDGGAGQLSVGIMALKQCGRTDIPILSLAKKEEEIYRPDFVRPVRLPRTDPGLRLLQHVRDEAHRFAVSYHRTVRDKKVSESSLESIPGVGKKRALKLLESFGSLDQVKVADPQSIVGVLHCSKALAEKIIGNSLG